MPELPESLLTLVPLLIYGNHWYSGFDGIRGAAPRVCVQGFRMAEYRALYRETRPEVFSEILGQDHIVKILRHQIASGTVSHAYLFCGTRGTGKTTTARILAKAVNCTGADDVHATDRPCGECPSCRAIADGTFMDVIEIDAASNNGVDNIRELRESVRYPPAAGRTKVYIIDEVHMLSTGAFNALLKTLEEPPEYVMFILATTNPEKMPQTVLSRCMRLDFRRVSNDVLISHMSDICAGKGIQITPDALNLLASNADGSVRDSLSILEQCISSGEPKLDRDLVLDFLGTVSGEFFIELTEKVMTKNISDAFLLLDGALRDGKDVRQLMRDWMAHCRSLLIARYVKNPENMLNMSADNIALLQKQSRRMTVQELNNAIITLAKAINDARFSTQARILMEVAIVSIASGMEYGKAANIPQTGIPQNSADPNAAKDRAPGNGADSYPAKERPPQDRISFVDVPEPVVPADGTELQQPGNAPATEATALQPDFVPAADPNSRGDTDQPARLGIDTEPPASARLTQEELDEIWHELFEEAENRSPKLNVMRRTTLTEIGETQFKVIVSSRFDQQILEGEQEMLSELMEGKTGRRLRMVCRMQGDDEEAERALEKEADAASKLLGVNVRIIDSERK